MDPPEDTKPFPPDRRHQGRPRCLRQARCVVWLKRTGWLEPLMRLLVKRPFIWGVNAGYRVVANKRQVFSRIFFPGQPGCRVDFAPKKERGNG